VTEVLSPEALASARALFPYTTEGRIYLNHASTGPLSTRVVDAMTAHLGQRSRGKLETYLDDVAMVSATRTLVQRMIHAESDDRIAFLPNTSDAINVIAAGLPWKSGDRVVLNTVEFPANIYPYLNLKRFGVQLDFINAGTGAVTPQKIIDTLTPRTRLVALSAVQFLSGHRADLGAIGEICRSRGVIFAVDGIQAVGAIRVDVQRMNIDALAAGCQKWQMAPHGTAFLYLSKELQSCIQQASLGWLSVDDPWRFYDYDQPLASSARRYEGGSLNMPGLWGLHAALETLLEFGTDAIEAQVLGLTGVLLEGLRTVDGLTVLTPSQPEERAGIVTVALPPNVDGNGIMARIGDRGVTIAVREGKLRFSPHFYNTTGEMISATEATRESIAQG
jgi:selenocysteine lyase/cysteine desulfurase